MNGKPGVTAISRVTDVVKCIGEGNDRVTKISPQTVLSMSTSQWLLKSLEPSRLILEDKSTQSYASSPSKRIPNRASISVPIDNYVCPVALTVFGPEFSFVPNEKYILTATVQIAKEISAKLGEHLQV